VFAISNKSNQEKESIEEVSLKKEMKSWIQVIVIALIIGLSISYVVKPTVVSGLSMYPTLDNSDYLLMNRLAYVVGEPQNNDVVVFHANIGNGDVFIKRVIGIEGDSIKISDGKVSVNGKEIKEDYINGAFSTEDIETIVPKDHLFVMGDNRDNSFDSRYEELGFVHEKSVIGKVFIRLFPNLSFPQ